MMKKLALLCLCLVVGLGSGWASVTGTTNPALFNDSVNWCQFGCGGNQLATPQSFVSGLGSTGSVGLVGTLQGFYNLQQGSSWNGNFANAMGLIYNGASFGNTPTQIATTLDQGVTGVGAYIQANFYGPFTASIELFDSSYQSLGIYTMAGTSDGNAGTALFIGAFGSAPVWAAQFDVIDQFGAHDFAIGSLGLSTTAPVPEPSSLLLMGSSALGLAGVLRRRFKGVL
jgi:hypothetical protein